MDDTRRKQIKVAAGLTACTTAIATATVVILVCQPYIIDIRVA